MKTAIHCAVFAMLVGSVSALADAAVEPGGAIPKRVVHFGDLDLTNNAGAATLYARIRYAAGAVCEPVDITMLASEAARRCVKQAIERAVADVNAPALTNYHLTKTGQSPTLAKR